MTTQAADSAGAGLLRAVFVIVQHYVSSAMRGTLICVRVTAEAIARVPVTNLRVSRSDFASVWITAEELCDVQSETGPDWYSTGVAATCEWLATVPRRTDVDHDVLCSPVTGVKARAHEELIDAELLAAERLAARDPRPARVARRPGWVEGIVDTLRWAWLHEGDPPLRADLAEAR